MQQTGSLRDWEGGSLLQALKVEGGYMAKDVRGLKELIVVPDDIASKEMEPQSYNHKELNSANKDEFESIFSLSASTWELSLANILISLCHAMNREPSHTALDFWPTEPWANKWVLLEATLFMLICYATIENFMC